MAEDGTHGEGEVPDVTRHLMAMDPTKYATNQAIPVPMVAGEEKLPCLWVGSVYDQYTKEVPAERPDKK